MKTNAWITYYVDHKQAMTLFDNLNENDEEEYNLSILSKNGDVFCTMDKFRMESVSIMKDVVEFHAQTDNIAYTASPTAVQGPTTNQGLEKCHWCGTPTKKVGGVTFRTVYDVCPKCMK
jgi:beta-glucanase (GH16 family)